MSSSQIMRDGMVGGQYQDPSPKTRASNSEDRLIHLIQSKGTIERYMHLVEKMEKGALDVNGYFKHAAVDAAINLTDLMHFGDSDKVRLEATKDILDRAGFNKTSKIAVAGSFHVDHDTSKMELVNLILSSARRAGIKVKDEDAVFAEPAKVIDVTPSDEPLELDQAPEE